jgi:putative SOS response-associated peptidase YedK
MCGRYRLSRRKQFIAEYFETDNEVDWEPRYNIAPSQPVGIIRQDPSRPERHFSPARWGLIPSWASDASIGFKTINARAETVATKPAFRDAFVSRRCLLPADGFFEWMRSGKEKQPFHFGMRDDSLFAFAGLWDRWRDPAGTVIESCSRWVSAYANRSPAPKWVPPREADGGDLGSAEALMRGRRPALSAKELGACNR